MKPPAGCARQAAVCPGALDGAGESVKVTVKLGVSVACCVAKGVGVPVGSVLIWASSGLSVTVAMTSEGAGVAAWITGVAVTGGVLEAAGVAVTKIGITVACGSVRPHPAATLRTSASPMNMLT